MGVTRSRVSIASIASILFVGGGVGLATTALSAGPAGAVTCTINGTAGNDVINVTTGGAVVCAGAGNDTVTLTGGGYNVAVYGGDGDDQITDNAGQGWLYGEAGADVIDASAS